MKKKEISTLCFMFIEFIEFIYLTWYARCIIKTRLMRGKWRENEQINENTDIRRVVVPNTTLLAQ